MPSSQTTFTTNFARRLKGLKYPIMAQSKVSHLYATDATDNKLIIRVKIKDDNQLTSVMSDVQSACISTLCHILYSSV